MARDFKDIQKSLSLRIRALRTQAGLTQEQLALQADVDRTYVSQIERAVGNPSLLVLSKLAGVLRVNVGEFFDNSTQ